MEECGFDVRPETWYHAHMTVDRGQELIYSWPAAPPDLWIAKHNTSGHPVPGGTYLYGIQYGNSGPGDALGVIITDVLPLGTTYAVDTSGFPLQTNGEVITWTPGTVAARTRGEFYVAVTVAGTVPVGSELEPNCATISAADSEDYDPENDGWCTGPVLVEEGDHGIWVDKWPSLADPHPGQLFGYEIQYGSDGVAATGPVWLTDTLPAGTEFVDWWEESGWQALWTEVVTTGGQLVLHAPAGIPGEMGGHLHLSLRLAPSMQISTTLENLIEVITPGDVNPENNWDYDNQAHVGPARCDMALRKEAGGGALVRGGEIRYQLQIQNEGNVTTQAWISDTLPPGTSYQPGSSWLGSGAGDPQPLEPVEGPAGRLAWDLGEVEVNQGLELGFTLDILSDAPDELENCASVVPDWAETTPWDNGSCALENVYPAGPNLRVYKRHDWNGDGLLAYHIRFENIGSEAVTHVWITDVHPLDTFCDGAWEWEFDGARLVAWDYNEASRTFLWNLDYLGPGESGWIQFNAVLLSPGAPLRWYTNTVEITVPDGDPSPGDNSWQDVAFSGGEVRCYLPLVLR
jgi:large repetitive protein